MKTLNPDLKVIMLTSHGDEYLAPCIEAGANGYLLKRANRAEIVSRAARRCTTAAEESCTTGTMRKD